MLRISPAHENNIDVETDNAHYLLVFLVQYISLNFSNHPASLSQYPLQSKWHTETLKIFNKILEIDPENLRSSAVGTEWEKSVPFRLNFSF